MPDVELEELTVIYENKGLSRPTAEQVARELTAHDALAAHLESELGITEQHVVSPWQAAGSSALSFLIGAVLPMLAILLPPPDLRVPTTFAAVLVALALTGIFSARLGGTGWVRPTLRIVLGGALALVVTFGLGLLLGTSVA
jgi:VIT1/CCC1 family predicted Fe2+/Mn2+ transporter